MRIGPRMMDLLWIVTYVYDGMAPSKSAAYMRLSYRGGSSNYYGSQVMGRCLAAGLLEHVPGHWGAAHPVAITEAGRVALALS